VTEQRQHILDYASRLLGRRATIGERGLQALQVVGRRGSPTVLHVWGALQQRIPGLAAILEDLGLGAEVFEAFPEPRAATQDIEKAKWAFLLRRSFTIESQRDWHYELTGAVSGARDSDGYLGCERIAASLLEAGQRKPDGKRTVSPVLGTLARSAGFSRPNSWTPETQTLCRALSLRLQELERVDPSCDSQQFVIYAGPGSEVKVEPFGALGAYRLAEDPLRDGSQWIARANAIDRSGSYFADWEIAELETLINRGALERDFQSFFEEHPNFLLALGDYVRLHPQLVLHEEDGGKLIPDFFLEKLNSSYVDICDLKRPTMELMRRQARRDRFRDGVMEAVAQVKRYRDWFDDPANRRAFEQRFGLNGFRPRVVVVVGRASSFYAEVDRRRAEETLPDFVRLATYDDIVARARLWQSRLSGPAASGTLSGKPEVAGGRALSLVLRAGERLNYSAPAAEVGSEVDRAGRAKRAGRWGIVARKEGRAREAVALLDEAITDARRVGNQRALGLYLGNLGSAWRDQGFLERAARSYREALECARVAKDRVGEAITLDNLGALEACAGMLEEAEGLFLQSFRLDDGTNPVGAAKSQGNLALVLAIQGRFEEANELALTAQRTLSNSPHGVPLQRKLSASLRIVRRGDPADLQPGIFL
jgi:tetratricopeptide (TPR) repeat protein